jgi:protein-tyrosine phosphatase
MTKSLSEQERVRVLFVCMGNICRSPTAEGVFAKLVLDSGLTQRIDIDSAGTHDYHIGKPPDERARKAALARNIDIGALRARKVSREDFGEFDYILAMDRDNYAGLTHLSPAEHRHKIRLLLDYAPHLTVREVPDPYFGGEQGFEQVLDMVEEAASGLLRSISGR